MGGLFPIYKETGSGVMFVYALGEMRAVWVVCVGGGAVADGWVWMICKTYYWEWYYVEKDEMLCRYSL